MKHTVIIPASLYVCAEPEVYMRGLAGKLLSASYCEGWVHLIVDTDWN